MAEPNTKTSEHSGYLLKKGSIIRTWRERWCHIHEGWLDTFKAKPSQKHEKARPNNTIRIRGSKLSPTQSSSTKYKHSFQVVTTKRVYYFCAKSVEDFQIWKQKLLDNGAIPSEKVTSFIREDGQVLPVKPKEISAEEEAEALIRENESLRKQIELVAGQSKKQMTDELEVTGSEGHVSVVVIGASGDLAKKKTFPSLFYLYALDLLPVNCTIFGYARSKMAHEDFRKFLSQNFKGYEDKRESFLKNCFYFSGQYDSKEGFAELDKEMSKRETDKQGNRLFYFAIPPSIFVDVGKAVKASAMAKSGWTRVVVEKPFGRDSQTFAVLSKDLLSLFSEEQIYRIDHYLGKEMVQNLMALRFANTFWEPIWSRKYISSVLITFKEDIGTEGRGGYFDEFGIIRDVMQNHLLQIMALVAMEPPVTMDAEDVRDEKVKVLLSTSPIVREETVIGQYGKDPEGKKPSYLDDPGVPKDSVCPTFATAVLHINNSRWKDVPFILKCGKALNERKAEIRVQFKDHPSLLYSAAARNELVITVQPKEAVYMKVMAKNPGLQESIIETELDLTYKERFDVRLPDAYERLIYDSLRGDHNLFVRDDELRAAWEIFTPLLKTLETEKVKPEIYAFGGRGPVSSDELIKKVGYIRSEKYQWKEKKK